MITATTSPDQKVSPEAQEIRDVIQSHFDFATVEATINPGRGDALEFRAMIDMEPTWKPSRGVAAESLRQIAGKLLAAAAELSGSDELSISRIQPEYRFSFGRDLDAEIAVFNCESDQEAELRARELMALIRGVPSDQPAQAMGAA